MELNKVANVPFLGMTSLKKWLIMYVEQELRDMGLLIDFISFLEKSETSQLL